MVQIKEWPNTILKVVNASHLQTSYFVTTFSLKHALTYLFRCLVSTPALRMARVTANQKDAVYPRSQSQDVHGTYRTPSSYGRNEPHWRNPRLLCLQWTSLLARRCLTKINLKTEDQVRSTRDVASPGNLWRPRIGRFPPGLDVHEALFVTSYLLD